MAFTYARPPVVAPRPAGLGLGVLAINGGEAVAVAGRLMLDEASMAKRRVAADATRAAPSVDGYGSARRAQVWQWTR